VCATKPQENLYKREFGIALQEVRLLRGPRAKKFDYHNLGREAVERQEIFDCGVREISIYRDMSQYAKIISINCFCRIVIKLLHLYGHDYEIFAPDGLDNGMTEPFLAVCDRDAGALLLFKEIEQDLMWKVRGSEPEKVDNLIKEKKLKSCKYVYLMYDKAYLQVLGWLLRVVMATVPDNWQLFQSKMAGVPRKMAGGLRGVG